MSQAAQWHASPLTRTVCWGLAVAFAGLAVASEFLTPWNGWNLVATATFALFAALFVGFSVGSIELYSDHLVIKQALRSPRSINLTDIESVTMSRGGIEICMAAESGGQIAGGPMALGAVDTWVLPNFIRRRHRGVKIAAELQAAVSRASSRPTT